MPGCSATGACFDQFLQGDQRLARTPVEIVRQATTEAALGSTKHLFGYRNKYSLEAQSGTLGLHFEKDARGDEGEEEEKQECVPCPE